MDPVTPWYLLAAVLVVVGLLGTVLPVLPGLPLMFAGMLLAAWAGGFAQIGAGAIALLALITVAALAVDVLATLVGAKRVGASRKAMWGAALGTFAGFFFGIAGLLLGPFAGAMAGEMADGREWREASRIGLGAWVGLAVGAAVKLSLAFAMLAVFGLALWID